MHEELGNYYSVRIIFALLFHVKVIDREQYLEARKWFDMPGKDMTPQQATEMIEDGVNVPTSE